MHYQPEQNVQQNIQIIHDKNQPPKNLQEEYQ